MTIDRAEYATIDFNVTRNTVRDPGWIAYVCAHIHIEWAKFGSVADDDRVAYSRACDAGIVFG